MTYACERTVTIGPVLNTNIDTLTVKAEDNWPKEDLTIIYLSKISTEKGEIRIKPISLKDLDWFKDRRDIHCKALVGSIEIVKIKGLGEKIILCLFEGWRAYLPSKTTKIILESNNSDIDLGKLGGYQFRTIEDGYEVFLDIFASYVKHSCEQEPGSGVTL